MIEVDKHLNIKPIFLCLLEDAINEAQGFEATMFVGNKS